MSSTFSVSDTDRVDRLASPIITASITLSGLLVTSLFFVTGTQSNLVPGVITAKQLDNIFLFLKLGIILLFVAAACSGLAVYSTKINNKENLLKISVGLGAITFGSFIVLLSIII